MWCLHYHKNYLLLLAVDPPKPDVPPAEHILSEAVNVRVPFSAVAAAADL